MVKINIPPDAGIILKILYNNGFEAYVVGGCVRDSLLGKVPYDWDITTNALPGKIIKIFESLGYKVIPTGLKHGTVTVLINNIGYEITTYRIDGDYSDNRHPDAIVFTNNLEKDLSRRDFTINAMAYNDRVGLVDYFHGLTDIEQKIICCVGNPLNRYREDSLRMLRAIRFASQLNFNIETSTRLCIKELSKNINNISKERIRDELCKILISDNPVYGIKSMVELNLIDYIIPELKECVEFNQHNKHHDKDVFNHILSVVENTPSKLELRLAALLHDIGKPRCFTLGEDGQGHFIGHQKISAGMSREILVRLRFDNKTIDKVCLLVYEHMSRYDKIKTSNIKKFINRVGINNLDDLFQLQIADIKGCTKEYHNFDDISRLKEQCNKIINEKQPISVKDLDISGKDLISLGIKQGKDIGVTLNQLLELVLENPELNTKEKLIKIVKCL